MRRQSVNRKKTFPAPYFNGTSKKNEYQLQFTEMKRVDPDSRQSGNAASAKLPTVNAKQ
jgi:phage protein U